MFLFLSVLSLFAVGIRANALAAGQQSAAQQLGTTALVNANNEFSFKIFKSMAKAGNNDIMSSFSIQNAFGMLMSGAVGETLSGLKRYLEYENATVSQALTETSFLEGFKSLLNKYHVEASEQVQPVQTQPDDGYFASTTDPARLLVNNRFVHDTSFDVKEEYIQRIRNYFNASYQSADFANNSIEETKKVNDWVSNATKGKITKIFDKIPESTSFVILNALYFRGDWYDKFYNESNTQENFYNNGTTPVKTEMMHARRTMNHHESTELDAQFLELRYYGKDFSKSNLTFVVALPKQRNGLEALKQKLNANNFRNAVQSMAREDINLTLPKFKVEAEYDLLKQNELLPESISRSPNLSRMTTKPQAIAEIKHKVFIAIDEKGTEAAAVTLIRGFPTSLEIFPRTVTFKVDHPFLFFIYDKSNGMILFTGQVNKF